MDGKDDFVDATDERQAPRWLYRRSMARNVAMKRMSKRRAAKMLDTTQFKVVHIHIILYLALLQSH